jgi:hypothetical protein
MTTSQERQRVIELLEAAGVSGASAEATARLIREELPHLTSTEIAEICRVNTEGLLLDAAVYSEQARASKRIAEIIRKTGEPDLDGTLVALATRSQQGDRPAAELLEELEQALTVAGMDD